ncbi:MAG: HlyD family efflux transporter periplasmic adaptor subunit [Bacteroidales bacterium]|nr:HlyD family efflux transporter periplasmic adaptor subunit [Bacteroidales bacterium]
MKISDLIPVIAILFASCSGTNDISDAYGNFEVDNIIVSAEANGKLLLLNVEEGKSIKANEVVAVIDTIDYVLKRKQLKAQKRAISSRVENIQSQIEVQEQQKKNLLIDKRRIENLMKDGAATQKQLDDINGKIDLVNSQIESIKTQTVAVVTELEVIGTQISQVEESINKCNIKNPINGIVLEKYAEENEITAFGKPLYKIADMREMILRVYVSGNQLPHIKIGQEVEVLIDEDKQSNKILTGVVSWISESAEFTPKIIQTKEERVNMVYAVKVRVENEGSLKIGMPGEVNF